MNVRSAVVVTLVSLACAGCGTVVLRDYPNRLVGADGQRIVLDDIQAIVGDSTLSDDAKRQQLRGLGIEDEMLIEALLGL